MPEQAIMHSLSEKYERYSQKVLTLLENQEIRALADNRNETIGKKIRDAEVSKVPYMLIVGEQEAENGTVSVRKHGEGDIGTMSIEDFAEIIKKEVQSTLKSFEV